MSWAANSTPNTQLAGWWYRVGATVIDGIIVGIVARVIGIASTGVYYTVLILGNLLYTALLLNYRGQTVGMMALGTRCVDQGGGGPIGTGRAFGRTALAIVLQFTVIGWILDILWPLWDAQNQTLHDKAISSLVVRTRVNVAAPPYPQGSPGAFGTGSPEAGGGGWTQSEPSWPSTSPPVPAGPPPSAGAPASTPAQGGGWGQAGGWQTAPGSEPPPAPPAAGGWQTAGGQGWQSAPAAPPPPTPPPTPPPVQSSPPQEQSIPAAWYPDPAGTGQERWWDGKSWTDHLRAPS